MSETSSKVPTPPTVPAPAPQPAAVEPGTEKPKPAVKPALKRKLDNTVADAQEDPLTRHLKEFAPEPLDTNLDTQAFFRLIRPDLTGFFNIIEKALTRIHNSFGFLQRPGVPRDDQSQVWLRPLQWACLREFLLVIERYETQYKAPRAAPTHNRLLLPMDVTYAIQCMRPFEGKDSPVVIVDYAYAFAEVGRLFPTFTKDDFAMLVGHQTLVAFLQSRRLSTLSSVNPDWKISLLATAVVEEHGLRAYICQEKLTWVNMLFALQLNFFRSRCVNGVAFVPVLKSENAIMTPFLAVHKRGDLFDSELMWQERISGPLAFQGKN